nr:EAL domain-containing protein [uncultured Pseudodesulfovibrio sp.]
MVEQTCPPVDESQVREILESRRVNIFFQPVVAIASQSIIGFEAFSRVAGDECCLGTQMLFHKDLSSDLVVGVDRMCRDKALEKFTSIHDTHSEMLLYLNVNVDITSYIEPDVAFLSDKLEKLGINPGNIVLEGVTSSYDLDRLGRFCRVFRELGVKICLDSCSVDESFNIAISKLCPEFVKLNRSFFGEAERRDYSAKTLETLLSVADHVGSSVVGCGVETEEESIRLLLAGVDLQQGYYYTKGEDRDPSDPAKLFREKMVATYDKYLKVKNRLVRHRKEWFAQAFKGVSAVCSKLSNIAEERLEDGCRCLVHKVDGIISLFILDDKGRQITRRIPVGSAQPANRPDVILKTNIGSDHSVEDYSIYLDIGYEKFVTPPFASPFTGEQACLISRPFFTVQGTRYVACVEMAYPG